MNVTVQVAVVIPTHNRGPYTERAVQSVLAQSYSDLRVIVIDDGSTDDTAARVSLLEQSDRRILYLRHDRNRGAQAARNTGVRASESTEWIAFLDSDDQWLPRSLELRLEMAAETGTQVVHSECYIQNVGSSNLTLFGVPPMQGQVYKQLLQRPGPMFPSLLVRREALGRIGYLDEAMVSYQEWDTAIRLAEFYEFAFVSAPTFIYHCGSSDAISNDRLRAALGYERVFKKHLKAIVRCLGLKGLALHYECCAHLYRQADCTSKANRLFVIALLLWPFELRRFAAACRVTHKLASSE